MRSISDMKRGIRIHGSVTYQDIGMGFWGIIDNDGRKWLPVNMPEQLKVEGARVRCTVRELEDDVSIHMWGKTVKILSFQTPALS